MNLSRHCTTAVYHKTVAAAIKAKKIHNLALKKSGGGPSKEVKNDNGTSHWMLGKALHRTNGPAQRYRGVDMWLAFGKLHRIGGPAEIPAERYVEILGESWWLYGIPIGSWEEYQAVTGCPDSDLAMLILRWGVRQ